MNITVRVLAAQAQRMLMQMQRQIAALNFANATAGARGFGAALGGAGITRFGSQMQWLGRQIEYNFTLPLVLAGAAVTKMALNQEKALTRIKKVYGDGARDAQFYASEIKALEKAFVALSNQFGIAQADVLNIAADWAAAGASGLSLAKAVQLTMKTMVLGELEAATATKSLIAIQAQYGQTVDELTETINILNMVENQTGTSMKDLIDGFSRAAGIAKTAGVSVRELAADIAALTPATGSAANAGNALKTIFSRLISTTGETSEVLKLMGINVQGMAWQSSSAQEKLLILANSFKGLSDAQKGFVSSIIASRYQVNRFEVLMSELLDPLGYYKKAIDATSDRTQVYTQAQKELNAVLTSNPQRLKIIWTTMQNAATDIIQPMIPMILWLAEAIQKLVTAFSNLNPAVQKFILVGLTVIAIVGPMIRIFGALQILLFELASMFRYLLIPVMIVIRMLAFLIAVPIGAVMIAWGAALRVFLTVMFAIPNALRVVFTAMLRFTTMIPVIVAAVSRGFAAMQAATIWFAGIMGAIWRGGWAAVQAVFLLARLRLSIILTGMFSGFQAILVAGWARIVALWRAGLLAVQTATIAWAATMGIIWRVATTNPIVLVQVMFATIIGLFVRAAPAIRAASTAVMAAMTGPWGIAISGIILLIVVFWKQIKQIFENGANFFRGSGQRMASAFSPLTKAVTAAHNIILKAFNALPSGIQRALLAVVRTVAAAAKAVYSWMSYINPWARHSPSLVDNVTTGVAEIARQYDSLTGIGSAFAQAADDLEIFAAATRAVNRSAEANKYAEIRKDLLAMAADAVPAFDRLIKELYTLEDQLKGVEEAMEAQESVVDALKSQLDSANDALDMQKDILQKMKEEADGYQDTINAINGDLEVLTGTREALRTAGAGSEILGPMDEQIKMLKDQRKGINDQLDAAKKAYEDQKKLIDDLTAARDKLQASYDLEKKKLEEIAAAYDKIRERISDITGAINDFASSVQALEAAKGGKGSGLADDFAAGAGADFEDVGGSGRVGREGGIGDQTKEIEDFTKKLQDETKKMFGMFNFLDPIKKGWNAAWGWVKDTFGPIASFIGDFFASLFVGISNPIDTDALMEGFDTFTEGLKSLGVGIRGFFEATWRLIGPPLMELWEVIKEAVGGAIEQIAPQITKFKDLWEPLQKLWIEIVPVLKVLGAIIGGVLLLAITIVVNVLKNALGPILNWIIDVIKSVIQIFRGLIEVLVGVFTGDWELAWQGIKDIFIGTWNIIWSTLKNVVLLIWGIVKGLVEGIIDFFVWLWDELVGHSIVPDIVNGVLFWFNLMSDSLKIIWQAIVTVALWVWTNGLKPIWDGIVATWQWVVDRIRDGVEQWKQRFETLKQIASNLWERYKDVVGWIKDKFWELVNNARDVVSGVLGWIDTFMSKVLGIKTNLKGAFNGMFDGMKDAFKSAVNWIIGKWNGLSFGVGPFSADTPNIPYLARGGKTNGPAVVGEGNPNFAEYVIPTDPQYRKRAWALFDQLAADLGVENLLGSGGTMKQFASALTRGVAGDKIQFYASGGVIGGGRIRGSARGGVVVIAPQENNTIHFHGNIELPNIKDGTSAEEFVKNLRALVGKL